MRKMNLKHILITIVIGLFGTSCGDLVVKVDKNNKNDGSELAAATERYKSAIEDADFFLSDMDNLRTIAFDMLMRKLEGRDFRTELRKAIREYRAYLISRAEQPRRFDHLDLESLENFCDKGRLNLNIEEANRYLGIIMTSAVLSQLSEVNAKALNKNLGEDAAAISQLIVKELGLRVDGKTTVERTDDAVETIGNVRLGLVPFEDESQEAQDLDAEGLIELSFHRLVDNDDLGFFKGSISVTDLVDGELVTYTMDIKTVRERNDDELLSQHVYLALNSDAKGEYYKRQVSFVEKPERKVAVIDHIAIDKESSQRSVTVDLGEAEKCLAQESEGEDDANEPYDFGNEDSDASNEKDADGKKQADDDAVDESEDETQGEDLEDEEDEQIVNDPGKGDNNPGQNPGQS